jgi:hypothetical protein
MIKVKPTHWCKICGAYWVRWSKDNCPNMQEQFIGQWTLVSSSCEKCCDNEVMGDQIMELPPDWRGTVS